MYVYRGRRQNECTSNRIQQVALKPVDWKKIFWNLNKNCYLIGEQVFFFHSQRQCKQDWITIIIVLYILIADSIAFNCMCHFITIQTLVLRFGKKCEKFGLHLSGMNKYLTYLIGYFFDNCESSRILMSWFFFHFSPMEYGKQYFLADSVKSNVRKLFTPPVSASYIFLNRNA
jgi:hypothetical protein